MLSIDEARAGVLAEARGLEAEDVAVSDALGRVLAEDVPAAQDVPGFANSAMDGFAVRSGGAGRRLRIVGESRAGAPAAVAVGEGEAVRISTGAMLPAGADAVLQIELCEVDGDAIVLGDDVAPDRNVRHPGEDMAAGARVLAAGKPLGPAELGVAVNAGRATVRCARRPRVAILATGDELVDPGAPLGPGQIHDSNAPMLRALATQAGARATTRRLPDDRAATEAAIGEALDGADLVVLSGGVSVGPHDHVKPALAAQGVEEVFWRVALRPGRPTWFGVRRSDQTLVLGLPGNPVSAYVTFVLFARPALAALQGADPRLPMRRARLAVAVARHPDRDECVRVAIDATGAATPTGPQGSHVLSSLLGADGLAVVPRGEGALAPGSEVDVYPAA
ncbi:MAG: molybdopterin molybdotransferase [Solirubrobacteraceae bacterium]|jgi:molybdopterin molybdotransferase|nr:molybdopterin molybdotransferase [Solirubrobacteraceae bacterium]